MTEELVSRSIELPSGELRLLQPEVAAELPDMDAVEWAPVAPYWSILWRSGVALACELDGVALHGLRIVELGCGLAVPSIAAARAGAAVLATDACADALTLVARNARRERRANRDCDGQLGAARRARETRAVRPRARCRRSLRARQCRHAAVALAAPRAGGLAG